MPVTDRFTELLEVPLRGFASYWRYALTNPEYRIIYDLDRENQAVKLLMMGPRKDDVIYRRLKYVPNKGPEKISMEMVAEVESEYIAENDDILDLTPPAQDIRDELLPNLTEEKLEEWRVPKPYWLKILKCQTAEDLLDCDIPEHTKVRVLDCLFPRSIELVVSQPTYVVTKKEDFTKVKDGLLSRLLLNLDKEQLAAIDHDQRWPILIKGGPGTGKSVVALYKAASLISSDQQQIFAPPRILFTTFTNSLINASRELFAAYMGDVGTAIPTIRTVNSMASSICRKNNCDLVFVTVFESLDILQNLLPKLNIEERKTLPGKVDKHYLLEEIQWVIQGWDLKNVDEYIKTPRTGRKIALNERQRNIIWSLYTLFRKELTSLNKFTYEEAQTLALEFTLEGKNTNPDKTNEWLFDYVFVDEAQDLTPVGLRLCAALSKNPINIYLTADMNQAIYGKGVSWKSVVDSLNFRGNRTFNLKKNYRSTDQMLRAADDLVRGLEVIDNETVYTEPENTGPKPYFRRFSSNSNRDAAIAKWIQDALGSLRLPLGCAAVLCPTRKSVDTLTEALHNLGLPATKFSDKEGLDTPKVKVMPIHGSKGLEFPVVVIPDFRADAFAWLAKGDRQSQVEIARRLYFVACTRAMKRLLVCSVGEQEDALHLLITTDNWDT